MENIIPSLMAVLLLLWLSGCASSSVPQDHFYRLPTVLASDLEASKAPKKPANPLPLWNSVSVERFRSDVLHNQRALLYVNQSQPLEIHRYHYHHWVDTPVRLIQQHLLEYLKVTGIAKQVNSSPRLSDSEYRIGGNLLEFERVLGDDGIAVVVSAEMFLTPKQQLIPVLSKSYRTRVSVQQDTMHATVQAFHRALIDLYYQFIHDVSLDQ